MSAPRPRKKILKTEDGTQREILADFLRTWSKRQGKGSPADSQPPESGGSPSRGLPPRLRQTLDLLLTGDSEKQIARRLSLSPHTIHDYVKAIYRRFGVGTRAELLALWVRRTGDSDVSRKD
ncbi:MAG TPA: LuxR C-terminal-related transcriptional regulator [Tepidisphaeraceae bacterium]|nr:LuxR C-terminal-related transcriptional regulator [Tepidisphaeraceae bacterium]